jgi:membrane fusion protein, multidrug efflux system
MPEHPQSSPQSPVSVDNDGGPAEELHRLREHVKLLEQEQERLRSQVPPPERSQPRRRSRVAGFLILLVILGALATGGFFLLRYFATYETTDDAQVDGHLNPISARINGTLAAVHVVDNQTVKAGDPLADIDARDYQVAVEQERAALVQAHAQVRAEDPSIPIIETSNRTAVSTAEADVLSAQAAVAVAEGDYQAAAAKIQEAEANAAKAQSDLARYKELVEKDDISRQVYDQAAAAAKASAATVESNRASAAAAQRLVEQRRAELAQSQSRLSEANANGPPQLNIRRANVAVRGASVAAAKVQLDRALLDLSYCKILAPVSGIVTKKSAEVGQRVAPGQQLLYIVQTEGLWVTANFKETQLKRIRANQPVSVKIDALQQSFDGYVDSVSGATGARTSLLPPENATGNYVKVVQRLPVRILFKPGQTGLDRLRAGMSAEPTVWLER